MRPFVRPVALGFLAVALFAGAATAQTAQDIIELTRQELATERQAIVANVLELTEEQGAAFWPLYREYRNEMARSGDRLVNLITNFAANYGEITDVQAAAKLDEWLSIQQQELKTKQRWVKKFEKVLPSTKVALLYQVENKLDAIINLDLAAEIPLIR